MQIMSVKKMFIKKLKKCFIRTKDKDIEVEKNTCKFFKNMVNPKIVVNDTQNVIGAY